MDSISMSYTSTPIERSPAVNARMMRRAAMVVSRLTVIFASLPRKAPMAEPSFEANSGVIFTLKVPTNPFLAEERLLLALAPYDVLGKPGPLLDELVGPYADAGGDLHALADAAVVADDTAFVDRYLLLQHAALPDHGAAELAPGADDGVVEYD